MMLTRRHWLAACLALGGAALASPSFAAQTTATTIQVSDMHCATCARKIAGRIVTVPGVLNVRTNLATHTATITPQQTRTPSPKALWEAVEKAGFKPVKLTTPAGTFDKKPSQ